MTECSELTCPNPATVVVVLEPIDDNVEPTSPVELCTACAQAAAFNNGDMFSLHNVVDSFPLV